MLDKASLKLGLDRAVLQSMSGNKESNVNGVRQAQHFNAEMRLTFFDQIHLDFWKLVLKKNYG